MPKHKPILSVSADELTGTAIVPPPQTGVAESHNSDPLFRN